VAQSGSNRRTLYILLLCLVPAAIAWSVNTAATDDEDFRNNCYFCHMDALLEIKAEAAKHWDAGVDCDACHGPSVEHVMVEDNSVLPEMVWNDGDMHGLCGNCHEDSLQAYKKSKHGRQLAGGGLEAADAKKPPSCATCHGYHGFKTEAAMQKECLVCHGSLPEVCRAAVAQAAEGQLACGGCHDAHTLSAVRTAVQGRRER
jgi:hypothetical protein